MKHIILSGMTSALFLTAIPPSFAQSTANGQFQTNTNVAPSCTVSSTVLNMTRSINPTKPDFQVNGNAEISVTCTQGTPALTLLRNTGLNTICMQNGLADDELLLKSQDGSLMPYKQRLQSHMANGRLIAAGGLLKCNHNETTPLTMVFTDGMTNTVNFEMIMGLKTGYTYSEEAKRLYNLATAGSYTDTLIFSVAF